MLFFYIIYKSTDIFFSSNELLKRMQREQARNLLVGPIVDEVSEENANGDIELEQYIQCSTNS